MSEQPDGLWWTLMILDSAVGAGMFIYGIRQKAALPLMAGIALNVLPFLTSTGLAALAMTLLVAIAWFVLRNYL